MNNSNQIPVTDLYSLPENNPVKNKPNNTSKLGLIIGITIVITAILSGGGVFAYMKLQEDKDSNDVSSSSSSTTSISSQQISTSSIQTGVDYQVVIKENSQAKDKYDIFLKNPNDNNETFFITLDYVYFNHYHNSEYHNGNLYIIIRTGQNPDGSFSNNWTDELWRYDSQKSGEKLYSSQGLDFAVSDEEEIIAVDIDTNLILLDKQGEEMKTISRDELILNDEMETNSFNINAVGGESVWITINQIAALLEVIKIDTDTFKLTRFDVSSLDVKGDYALNPVNGKFAYSDFPMLLDEPSMQNFIDSQAKVTLYVYELSTKKKSVIDTSIVKLFDPKWIDDNTLEYNDPKREKRIQKNT